MNQRRAVCQIAAVLWCCGAAAGSAQGPAQLQLTETRRIGSLDRENYDLSGTIDVAVADDGTLFVAQYIEATVKVFDRNGRFIRRIGRKGGGPGEFKRISAVEWTSRGLYVEDESQTRLTLFTRDGKVVRSWSVVSHDFGPALRPTAPEVQFATGELVVIPGYSAQPNAKPVTAIPIALANEAGKAVSTLVMVKRGDQTKRVSNGKASTWIPMPNATHTLHAFLPSESAVILVDRTIGTGGKQSSFTITKVNVKGDTLFRRAYTEPARLIVGATRSRAIARAVDVMLEVMPQVPRQLSRDFYQQAWSDVQHESPVDRVIVGRDGSIWLRRGAFGETTASWILFSRTGAMVGMVSLPVTTRPVRGTATQLIAVEAGEFDEEYVVEYSVSLKR